MDTEDNLDRLFVRASRAHYNLASQVLSPLGLHRGQPPILFELEEHNGITQSELAVNLEITPATLTNLLNRLENAGLIKRVRDREDNRISNVSLTEDGFRVLKLAKEGLEEMNRITFAGFSADERSQLKEFLKRIRQNLTAK